MISIIVCSRQDPSRDLHRSNVAKTVGCDFEYVRVDNSSGRFGLGAAYNRGISESEGDICVFMHEDAFFMETGWGERLHRKFSANPLLGCVGVAGTQYLFADTPAWIKAGRPFIRGRVVHELADTDRFFMSVFSIEEEDVDVVVVDGLFMAIRRSLFGRISFDETTFDGFHFYDCDICMQIRRTHTVAVAHDILIKHLSRGAVTGPWVRYAARFREKYRDELPASCVDAEPDLTTYAGVRNVNLDGLVPRATIC